MKIMDGLKLGALVLATPSEDMMVDINLMATAFSFSALSLCAGQPAVSGLFASIAFWDFLKEGSYGTGRAFLGGDAEASWRQKKTPFNVVRELIQDNAATMIDDVPAEAMKPYVRLIARHLRSGHYAGVATHLLECIAAADITAIDPAIPDMVGFLRYGSTISKRTNGEEIDQKMNSTRQEILWILGDKAKKEKGFFAKIEKDLRKAIDRTACTSTLRFYLGHQKPQGPKDVAWLVGWLDNRQTQASASWALMEVMEKNPEWVEPYRAKIEAKTACFHESGRPLALCRLREAMNITAAPV